jgi:hypothetical protein
LREAGARDVRSCEIGSHAPRFEMQAPKEAGLASPTPRVIAG